MECTPIGGGWTECSTPQPAWLMPAYIVFAVLVVIGLGVITWGATCDLIRLRRREREWAAQDRERMERRR